jgi:carbonic anhydrase
MSLEKIRKGHTQFRETVYPKHEELFRTLALRQRPEALFITCADSRIDPCLLTQTQPGELFIARNAGNIVPPYGEAPGGISATIEYAVAVLHVGDVILCGHTDCGVMKGVLNPEALAPLEAISGWLKFAQPARAAAEKEYALGCGEEFALLMTQKNVLCQLENLKTHPSVAHRLEQGDLRLNGWVFHIGEGKLTEYSAKTGEFAPLGDHEPVA